MGKIRYFFAVWFSLFLYFVLQMPLSQAHWWQTLMLEEQSGQVVLTSLEKENVASGFTAFKICLDVIGEDTSLDIETKCRCYTPSNTTNDDFINYGKVWKVLEKQEIGDTLSAKWVISSKNKIILKTINNDTSIRRTGNFFERAFDGLWFFTALLLLIGIISILTAPKE